MNLTPGQDDEEETGRESRIKIALLATALVLVAGYAVSLTELGGSIPKLENLFGSKVVIGGAALGAVLLAAAFLVLRRRRISSPAPGRAEDALAGLAGRQAFLARLAAQCDTHSKTGRQFALHLIDMDRFALVNQALGVPEGDAFLRSVAERLTVLVDESDRLARVGDDEFAVIQPESGGPRHAEIYAQRIQDTLKEACAQVGRHVRPGASIGVAVWPDHGDEPARLLHSASLALHAAKQAGGDCFRIFTRGMDMAVDARVKMGRVIADGLHHGWFELLQPQYDLRSRRLTGFEALVRMQHPDRGELLPEEFLPAAEESGLMQPLGEWTIREALAAATHWPAHLTLAVNVSAAQFRQSDVPNAILQALEKAGIDASRLRLEIPESVLQGSDAAREQLRRLKAGGVAIVVDDFGLDSSSLQMLARSPCDAIKLDRSFVLRIGEDPETESLVRSLIGTARSFDLAVLAEGIERAEQAHFLLAHDCGNVQGYLFGRPAPMREVGAIIAKDLRKMVPESEASVASSEHIERRG